MGKGSSRAWGKFDGGERKKEVTPREDCGTENEFGKREGSRGGVGVEGREMDKKTAFSGGEKIL